MAQRTIQTDQEAVKASNDNSRDFKAIPPGTYEFTIRNVEERKAANAGPNSTRSVLNVQLRIADGQPHSGRVFFIRVPLFQRWAPSGKNPEGAPAFLYFQFYRALGYEVGMEGGDTLPDDKDLLGKPIRGKVVLKDADEYNTEPYNEVSAVWASEEPNRGAKSVAGNPWAPSPKDVEAALASTGASASASTPWGGKGF